MQTFGWIPDVPDHRDFSYKTLRPQNRLLKAVTRPRRKYLHEDNLPRIYDQSIIGSCVGHGVTEAVAYCLDYINQETSLDGRKPRDYSRLFAYYIARTNKDKDEGAYIREGIKAAARYGICREELWPYDVNKWAEKPSLEAYRDASKQRAIEYFRLEDRGDMLDCLAQGFPIVYGMALFESFNKVSSDGEVYMPGKWDAMIGGHCMLIVGYSLAKQAYFVRNSWGEHWGFRGHCWVPFEYIEKFGDDFWTVRKVSML